MSVVPSGNTFETFAETVKNMYTLVDKAVFLCDLVPYDVVRWYEFGRSIHSPKEPSPTSVTFCDGILGDVPSASGRRL